MYDENNYNNHKSAKCYTDSDCGDGKCCRFIGLTAFATCGPCTDDNPDDDYQVIFLTLEFRIKIIKMFNFIQGKRGKHGFLQGKRGKHGIYFSGGIDYQVIF